MKGMTADCSIPPDAHHRWRKDGKRSKKAGRDERTQSHLESVALVKRLTAAVAAVAWGSSASRS